MYKHFGDNIIDLYTTQEQVRTNCKINQGGVERELDDL